MLKNLSDNLFDGLEKNAIDAVKKKSKENPQLSKYARKIERERNVFEKTYKEAKETKQQKSERLIRKFGEVFTKAIE